MPIQYWNRKRARLETEEVYGGDFVNILYGNAAGLALTDRLLVRKTISRLYGAWQSTKFTSRKVAPFMKRFGVVASDFEPGPFASFNDFFIRQFLPGKRSFPQNARTMGAFSEGRYFGWEALKADSALPIKGLALQAHDMLGSMPGKDRFAGGPCLLSRLCPVDYHRFHFPDEGRTTHFHVESGNLHSVNPVALKRKPELFLTNERQISLLQTKNFGLLAYVEVGALCVGKIVQTHSPEQKFARGQEKGYFLFGGSTVIVYGEPGAWVPSADILENTKAGREVLVELGEPVATANKEG